MAHPATPIHDDLELDLEPETVRTPPTFDEAPPTLRSERLLQAASRATLLPPDTEEAREASGLRPAVKRDRDLPLDDEELWLDSMLLEDLDEPHDTEPAPPPTLRSAV